MPTAEVVQPSQPFPGFGFKGQDAPQPYAPTPAPPAPGHVQHFGIEVPEEVVWRNWEPGQEYTKFIQLKNIQVKTKKIKYRGPNTRFFTTLYPKPVMLSAGTSFSLPVTFRPLERKMLEDKVVFITKEGEFTVPIRATLPMTMIQTPELLDFNMCAVGDFVVNKFDVTNTGDTDTTLTWDCSEPFYIEPSTTALPHKGTVTFRVTFKPKAALKYKTKVVCRYGSDKNLCKTTTFVGVGKFPHLLLSLPGLPANTAKSEHFQMELNFGKVPVGASGKQMLELHNLSAVRASFKVEHPTGVSRIDTVFKCQLREGVVPPMTALKIPLTFQPNTVDTVSTDYFAISTLSNISKTVVKCLGTSAGPAVQLSTGLVNFSLVDIGSSVTRTVDIVNMCEMQAVFQFQIDCGESVFGLSLCSGVLAPNSRQTIILTFTPQHPINYYRRLTCLIHNQAPLFLDLMGTCHSEVVKPAVLKAKHLDLYQRHLARGLSVVPPELLNEMLKEGKLEEDEAGALKVVKPPEVLLLKSPSKLQFLGPPDKEELEVPSPPKLDEYFNDGHHTDIVTVVPHVSFDVNLADFGNYQNLRVIEDRCICATNHTRGKITLQWITRGDSPFSVYPTSVDIPPLKSCSFRVTFKPDVPNKFYGCEMECYAYYKSLRDYRLVEEATHCPPWCLTLTCTGHTYQPNNEAYLPRYTLDSPHIVFPAVNAKESAYRTLLMTRTGPNPILFQVNKDPSQTYQIKPAQGLLKGEHQIFIIKCSPTEVKTYKSSLTLRLNDNEKFNKELTLWGSAESADIRLENEGMLFFKPTCIGTTSERHYPIKNTSRIPLIFEWKLTPDDRKVLKVTPETGTILPNEILSQSWEFSPCEEEKYLLKPNLVVRGQGFSQNSSGGKKQLYFIRVVGEGSLGEIKVEKDVVDLGDLIVGAAATQPVTLYNNSDCSLRFLLLTSQQINDNYHGKTAAGQKVGIRLDKKEGDLTARSKTTVLATVRPHCRAPYQFSIAYQLQAAEGVKGVEALLKPQHLCSILVNGVYPSLAITDARASGSAAGISKKQLWCLFSLDNLNVCLDSDPSAEELIYPIGTRHSVERRPPVYTRAIMDFNFSAAPLGSEDCVISLLVENTGTVPAEWAFFFPCDLHIELEYWAETGEFDEDELHEMKVMDNKLFSISPKKGQLQPGETQTVTFSYRHIMAGTDRLPVLLKLSQGREILLNFVGVTVEPDRPYIHFPSNKHLFTPVPVGEKISPKQVYELFNGGAQPVQFSLDLTPLEIIQQENYNQPIFECLNPHGEIQPGRTAVVEWRFSPLEAKTYMVDVPILVRGGDTAVVTFTGVGYDKRIMGKAMPVLDDTDTSGVPSVQSATVPGQLAYLSRERIPLGNLPLFSRVRRMVFVINRSQDRPVSFEWHVTSQSDNQLLKVCPVRGMVEPGGSCMCRVGFLATGVPAFYDLDLVCEVTDEYEMRKYRARVKAWEKECERQLNEFTITEKDLDADQKLPTSFDALARQSTNVPEHSCMGEGELTRYKTLPPIYVPQVDQERERRAKQRKAEEQVWRKPVPPRPFLLHLGLTGRTLDVQQFQVSFPEEYSTFHIEKGQGEGTSCLPAKEDLEPGSILCSQAEGQVISGVLCNILRGLLDDTHFHDAVKKVVAEPIPYFRQFGTRPPSPPPTAPIHEVIVTPNSPPPCTPPGTPPREPSPSGLSRPTSQAKASIRGSVLSSPHQRESPPLTTEEVDLQADSRKEKQAIKKMSETANVIENILENTVLNIMQEALSGEFNITARSRFIALPKRPSSSNSLTFK